MKPKGHQSIWWKEKQLSVCACQQRLFRDIDIFILCFLLGLLLKTHQNLELIWVISLKTFRGFFFFSLLFHGRHSSSTVLKRFIIKDLIQWIKIIFNLNLAINIHRHKVLKLLLNKYNMFCIFICPSTMWRRWY